MDIKRLPCLGLLTKSRGDGAGQGGGERHHHGHGAQDPLRAGEGGDTGLGRRRGQHGRLHVAPQGHRRDGAQLGVLRG